MYSLNDESIDQLQGGYYETVTCAHVPNQGHQGTRSACALFFFFFFIITLFSVKKVHI